MDVDDECIVTVGKLWPLLKIKMGHPWLPLNLINLFIGRACILANLFLSLFSKKKIYLEVDRRKIK